MSGLGGGIVELPFYIWRFLRWGTALQKKLPLGIFFLPDARNKTWWANPFVVVQLPWRVTITNISLWAWNGVQQTKNTNTTAAENKNKQWHHCRERQRKVNDGKLIEWEYVFMYWLNSPLIQPWRLGLLDSPVIILVIYEQWIKSCLRCRFYMEKLLWT